MCATTFTRVSHLDVTIDTLFDLWAGALLNISVKEVVIDGRDDVGVEAFTNVLIGIGMTLVGVEIGAAVASTSEVLITLEFVVSVSYALDVLVDVCLDSLTAAYSDDVTIATASGIGVDMLADVDTNVLSAVMAALKFIVPTPVAASVPFRC